MRHTETLSIADVFHFFCLITDQDCVIVASVDTWTPTPLVDEVVSTCLPDHNNDARDEAIFIRVITYVGDGTIYIWSSPPRLWWSESASSTTPLRTLPHSRCCRWIEVGLAHWCVWVSRHLWHRVIGLSSSKLFCSSRLILCASIYLPRWIWNNALLHIYNHVHLDLDYISIKGLHLFLSTPITMYA
jgi:hypothetical protein